MPGEDFKRKLAAILHADVKGYSRLIGEDEETTVGILTIYREAMGLVIGKHRGRVVHGSGDSLLAEFVSVVDAVRSAVEIQEELKARNAQNLIIGYDLPRTNGTYFCCTAFCSDGQYIDQGTCEEAGHTWAMSHKTGSHYLVIGDRNNYAQYGGLVVGAYNTSTGPAASVGGGRENTASGPYASVSGGQENIASGHFASVSGGEWNTASGFFASVGGGDRNIASGSCARVSGGYPRRATGPHDWVAGGLTHRAR